MLADTIAPVEEELEAEAPDEEEEPERCLNCGDRIEDPVGLERGYCTQSCEEEDAREGLYEARRGR